MQTQWERIDVPVLTAIAQHEGDTDRAFKNQDELQEALGEDWEEQVVTAALTRLVNANYLTAIDSSSMGGDYWIRPKLAERGRRTVGLWPQDDLGAALIRILDERIAEAATPEERSRWRKLRDSAANVGEGVVAGVVVEAAKFGLMY